MGNKIKEVFVFALIIFMGLIACRNMHIAITNNSAKKVENAIKNEDIIEKNKIDSGSRIEKKEENIIEEMEINFSEESSEIEKNNKSPQGFENIDYVRRVCDYTNLGGKTLYYKVPKTWVTAEMYNEEDPKTGAIVYTKIFPLSDFGKFSEETTYEEFLLYFMVKEKENDSFPQSVELKMRELVIDEYNKLVIIEKFSHYSVTEYVVLVDDDDVYAVSVGVSKEKYSEEFLNDVDSVLSTVYLSDF